MLRTGGENFDSREVAEAIYQRPVVAEVSVIGLPHPRWVEAMVAMVVLETDATLSGADAAARCTQQPGAFKVSKREPRRVHAVLFATE